MRSRAEHHPHRERGGEKNHLERASKVEIMGFKTPRSADLSRAQLSASQQTFLTFRRRRRLRSTFTLFWLRGGQNAQTKLDSGVVQIPQTRTEAAAERARRRRKVPSTEQSFGDAQSFRRSRRAALPTAPGSARRATPLQLLLQIHLLREVRTHRACECARARVWIRTKTRGSEPASLFFDCA